MASSRGRQAGRYAWRVSMTNRQLSRTFTTGCYLIVLPALSGIYLPVVDMSSLYMNIANQQAMCHPAARPEEKKRRKRANQRAYSPAFLLFSSSFLFFLSLFPSCFFFPLCRRMGWLDGP
ncbi:hypothetical protein BC567DRAFT_233994 [Phyllosticta citribraziliensis]